MATSRWEELPFIINTLRNINPRTVLDLGVGFGKIGLLIREYIEGLQGKNRPDQWKIVIEGMEIYSGYHKDSFQNIIYNKIYYDNILNIDKHIKNNVYDLITAFDVIEHLDKNSAIDLLNKLKNYGKYVLLSIPIGEGWWLKGTKENPYEEHKSKWEINDLNILRYTTLKTYRIPGGRLMGIFLFGK